MQRYTLSLFSIWIGGPRKCVEKKKLGGIHQKQGEVGEPFWCSKFDNVDES